MRESDYEQLQADVEDVLLAGAKMIGILGATRVSLRLLRTFPSAFQAVYAPVDTGRATSLSFPVPVRPLADLSAVSLDALVVAADAEKEDLLWLALPHLKNAPKVIVGGYGHLEFRDHLFHEIRESLLVPSLANGYPNSLVHIYQCLRNAARRDLRGVVAEFGMFKGGTTMFMSRIIERLGRSWPVLGFDTFDGFPPRRSGLDMYAHPDCVFTDLPAVRRYFEGRSVEIVSGDIVETCHRLDREDIVLAFLDTDNYTSAKAALEVVRERTVLGGAIVFDHYTGVDRFRYTLGERMAGHALADDVRYFNLHGTGVFLRQA